MKKSSQPENMKPANISFKTTPELKATLERLAEEGFRSLSAQIEMIVIQWLDQQGIDWKKDKKKPNPS
jgi:hypothetical protein